MPIASARVTAILLAAGRSERFGANKLVQPLAGAQLVQHAARTLSAIRFAKRIAVVSDPSLELDGFGFSSAWVPKGKLLSVSIAAGVAAALQSDCDACLIALGDMPLVPAAHFVALLDRHEGDVTATLDPDGDVRTVPAIFSRTWFSALQSLSGDRGASGLLSRAALVEAEHGWLEDIDTPADLSRLSRENS